MRDKFDEAFAWLDHYYREFGESSHLSVNRYLLSTKPKDIQYGIRKKQTLEKVINDRISLLENQLKNYNCLIDLEFNWNNQIVVIKELCRIIDRKTEWGR